MLAAQVTRHGARAQSMTTTTTTNHSEPSQVRRRQRWMRRWMDGPIIKWCVETWSMSLVWVLSVWPRYQRLACLVAAISRNRCLHALRTSITYEHSVRAAPLLR